MSQTTLARETGRLSSGSRKPRAIDRTWIRLCFLVPGAASLFAGLYAALLLLGLNVPVPTDVMADQHGILMVFGFVGTLIVLERAVAVKRWWAFTSPAALALGALIGMTPAPPAFSRALLVLGALGLLVIYNTIWRRQAMAAVAIQALGAFGLLIAALCWLQGLGLPDLAPGLATFLILTIVGERLELARVALLKPRAGSMVFALSAALLAALPVCLLWPEVGLRAFAVLLFAIVAWLAVYDIAFRTIKIPGLTRFMAGCLLSGYAWLIVAGGIWLVLGRVSDGPAYDAALHSVFLGFTMSMIMAHAPVILPAVLRRPLPYRKVMVAPVVLLHASLIARIMIGDAFELVDFVQWGGIFNEVALLLFVVLAATSVLLGPPAKKPERTTPASLGVGAVGRTATK